MKDYLAFILAGLAQLGLLTFAVSAHPGSGIVVDEKGQVLFAHTGVGVFKPDREGGIVRVEGLGLHFMAIDPAGRFAHQRWPRFPDGEIKVVGTNPPLLLSTSFPLVVGPDGALYYPEAARDGHVHVMRLTPAKEPTTFAILPLVTEIGFKGNPEPARWIHGLAVGRDGTLYYTEKHAVRRIGRDGAVSLVASNLTIPDCLRPPIMAEEHLGPALRGLAVAADGNLFVAASACSAVLKISPAGAVSVVLRSSDSWAPTGVAVAAEDIYVLEYRHIKVERPADWLPRVRKVSRDGTVTTIATVTQSRP